MIGRHVCNWAARTIVTLFAGGLLATAQPLPEIHDIYSSDRASRLGPETRATPLESWSAVVRDAGFVRFDFRLRIERPDGAAESSGRAELRLDGVKTVDFRVVLAETGRSLVPAGTSLVRIARDATADIVDPEHPAGPLDLIARYVSDLPVPGADDAPATETEPSVLHFARRERNEHVYVHFAEQGPFPDKIVRVVDGPTRVVLDIDRVSVE